MAALISEIPLTVIKGVRTLVGFQPIFTFPVVATVVLTLQYSSVLDTCNGAVSELAVELGVKYSAVQNNVLPAVEVRVNL